MHEREVRVAPEFSESTLTVIVKEMLERQWSEK